MMDFELEDQRRKSGSERFLKLGEDEHFLDVLITWVWLVIQYGLMGQKNCDWSVVNPSWILVHFNLWCLLLDFLIPSIMSQFVLPFLFLS